MTYYEKFPSLIGVGITLGDGEVYNQTQVTKYLLDKKRIIKLFEQAVFVEHLNTEQQDEMWNILEYEED